MRHALALVTTLLTTLAHAQDQPRPNIVVFLVDDMGWQDTSVAFHSERTPANERYRTPNMERLAEQGVVFTNAYAYAVCSPSRTSLMTGQSAARHRVTNWTLRTGVDQSGQTERLRSPEGWRNEGLQPDAALLPQVLHDAGYFTIHAGKAHWGAQGTAGEDPRALGFDVNIAGHCAGGPGAYDGRHDFSARHRGGDPIWDVPGLEAYHGLPVHLTDATTAEALQAVDQAIAADKPFYLYLAHYAIHTPIEPHEAYAQAYRERGLDETEARYASMIEGMDASLGAVLAHVERRGEAERTIILFASDNGGLSAHGRGASPHGGGHDTHNLPLRAGKGSAYEGGTRIPWIVSWAKPSPDEVMQQGLRIPRTRRDTPIMIEDVYPTVLAWAGLRVPDGHVCDGWNITGLLGMRGNGMRAPRALVFHYPHKWGPERPAGGYEPHSAMRANGFKVIWFYQRRTWELYDLVEDIGETQDLAATSPTRLRSMARRMVRELERLGAQYPTNRETGEPERPILPE